MKKFNIIIGSDHAGVDLKDFLKTYLEQENYNVLDIGTNSTESCDYPDIANSLALHIKNTPSSIGILICGTGIGMSIAVNRYSFIRGALVYSPESAKLARQHNDANVIILAARMFENKENLDFLNAFLTADFSKEERHKKRINKLGYVYPDSKENIGKC